MKLSALPSIYNIAFVLLSGSLIPKHALFVAGQGGDNDDEECMKLYEWSTSGEFGGYTFSGVVDGRFDTPLFDTPNVNSTTVKIMPIGKVQGEYHTNTHVAIGQWGFYNFEEKDWLVGYLGFPIISDETTFSVAEPNVILGGTGRWAGAKGTITNRVYSEEPFIVEFEICVSSSSPSSPQSDVLTECQNIYEIDEGNIVVDDIPFQGPNEAFLVDTPLHSEYVYPDPPSETLVARFLTQAHFVTPETFYGNIAMNFFDTGSWITGFAGVGPTQTPTVLTGGSGAYLGITGTMTTFFIEPPATINITLCPPEEPDVVDSSPMDECTVFYERRTSGNFGAYSFAGSDDQTGNFDTPFYLDMNFQNDEDPDGRVAGTYYPNAAGDSPGDLFFHFFEDDEWVTGRTGFGNGVVPNVVTGGTGSFTGFVGTVTFLGVVQEAPESVFQWAICPEGIDPPSMETTTDDETTGSTEDMADKPTEAPLLDDSSASSLQPIFVGIAVSPMVAVMLNWFI